jgi:NAD(P)-dependent dehydrogenase (short-subunit alcohol dehydrogenase family)
MGALDGKIAVVTGAGRGIGQAVAIYFANEGAKVVVNDPGVNVDGSGHDNGPAEQTVQQIKEAGGEAVANYDTVATVEGGENMIKQAVDAWGRIDILCNVAGILRDRMIFNMSPQEWRDVIDVHLTGQFHTTKPAAVLMRQQRSGRILNWSSTSGLVGNTGQANYGAAKAGVAGFTRVVAKDLGRYGVTANAIAPGPIETPLLMGALEFGEMGEKIVETMRNATQLRRLGQPEEVAAAVAFLASDDASYVTGETLGVSGGLGMV